MPSKSASPAVEVRLLSGGVSLNQSSNTTLLPVRLQWAAGRHDDSALLDSGAEEPHGPNPGSPAQYSHHLTPPQDPSQCSQRTTTFRHHSLHHTSHTHHIWQSYRDSGVFYHGLTYGPGGAGPSLAHPAHRVPSLLGVRNVMRLVLCLLVFLCLVFHCRMRR